MLASPLKALLSPRRPSVSSDLFCILYPAPSLRTYRRSSEARALEQKERLGSWLILQVPLSTKDPLKPLWVILTGRPGGPGSPGWPCKSNGRGSEAGAGGGSSWVPAPLCCSSSQTLVLDCQCWPLTLTPGIPMGPGSPLAPVRPWGRKRRYIQEAGTYSLTHGAGRVQGDLSRVGPGCLSP